MNRLGRPGIFYLLLVFTALGMLVMHEIPTLWHTKFYLDGQTLLDTPPALGLFAGSYRGTAWLFQPLFQMLELLGADLHAYAWQFGGSWLLANLLWALPYLFMVWVIAWRAQLPCTLGSALVLFSTLVLQAPFYASINKELVPMLFCFAFVLLLLRRRTTAALCLLVALAVVYGLVVRSYFLLLALLLPAVHLLSARRGRLVLALLAGAAVVWVMFPLIPRALIDIGRASYLEGIAATRIAYPFNDMAATGFVLNRLSAVLRIAFPLELVAGSPAYLPFVVFRCHASWLALAALGPGRAVERRAAASVVVAYTVVQAVFEPDFGSAFRHFIVVVPAVLLLQAMYPGRGRSG